MITLSTTDTLDVKKENRNFGIYNYGEDNLYPNNNRVLANNSSALKRCIKTYGDFLFGNGMTTSEDFWRKKVNVSGLRVDQFLRRLVKNEYPVHGGFAFKVVYNGALDPISVVPLPFETLRLAKSDDFGVIKKIRYHKDWSLKSIKKQDIVTYDVYNPNKEIIAGQIELAGGFENWNHQIFYYGENGEVKYTHCSFHASLEDVVTDVQLKKGRNANASTNFMASHILKLPVSWEEMADEIIATSPNENINREKVIEDIKQQWKDALGSFQSAENIGKIMMLTSKRLDNDGKVIFPELEKIDIQDYDKLYDLTLKIVKDNIRDEYQIPNILLEHVNTGFSTEEMEQAYNYYNNITQNIRQIFEEVFLEIFPKMFTGYDLSDNFSIQKLKYIKNETTNV